MTPVVLLTELKKFIEVNTKDIILSVRPIKNKTLPGMNDIDAGQEPPEGVITNRAPEVHNMRLPDKDAETNRIPYILLQLLTGKDEHIPAEQPDSICNIRIAVATYSEDGGEGAEDLLNVLTRIRVALLKAGEVGKQFLLRKPLEYIVYPDDTNPYYLGEMLTIWEMPTITREVHTHGEDYSK